MALATSSLERVRMSRNGAHGLRPLQLAAWLELAAWLAVALGCCDRQAARLFAAAASFKIQYGVKTESTLWRRTFTIPGIQEALNVARARLGDRAFEEIQADARAQSLEAAVDEALAVCQAPESPWI